MIDNNNGKPTTPLSDAEKARQAAALADFKASHNVANGKPETGKPTATPPATPPATGTASAPQNAPSKAADKPAGNAPTTTTAGAQNAPTGTASTTAAKPETGKAEPLTPVTGQAKALAPSGSKTNPLPDLAGKPQGGQPTTLNPHTAPVTAATPTQGGTAHKAKGKGKGKGKGTGDSKSPETTPTGNGYNVANVFGNIGRWPSWCGARPGAAELIAASVMIGSSSVGTKKQLALAFYLTPQGGTRNVFDIGYACAEVCGGNHTNNLSNVALNAATYGWCLLHKGAAASKSPEKTGGDQRQLRTYHATLFDVDATGKVIASIKADKIRLIVAAIEAAGVKVPPHFTLPEKAGTAPKA